MEQSVYRCECCRKKCDVDDTWIIDGTRTCNACLYGECRPIKMYPIGFVENDQYRDASDFGLNNRSKESRIHLFPSQKRFMYKLCDEERITVVYHLHKARRIRSRFARGYDGKEVGLFASRTPDRVSGIGISQVKLVTVQGEVLTVSGLDAVDGTPVLDIKMAIGKE